MSSTPFSLVSLALSHDVSQPVRLEEDDVLCEKEAAKVELMRHSDVSKGLRTLNGAFANDPLQRYMNAVPDRRPPLPGQQKMIDSVVKASFHRQIDSSSKDMRTIEHGGAVVTTSPAPSSLPGRSVDKAIDATWNYIVNILAGFVTSPEQRKRQEELRNKAIEAMNRILGERRKDMVYVDLLCTAPASQGKGYGGMLLDTVTAIADAQGRATYLFSSNTANTDFYASHGFVTVAEIPLGEDNPTWQEAPIIVPLMVREAKSLDMGSDLV